MEGARLNQMKKWMINLMITWNDRCITSISLLSLSHYYDLHFGEVLPQYSLKQFKRILGTNSGLSIAINIINYKKLLKNELICIRGLVHDFVLMLASYRNNCCLSSSSLWYFDSYLTFSVMIYRLSVSNRFIY